MKPNALQPEFDFKHRLPAGREWFSVRFIARYLGKSPQHIINLIQSGELEESFDVRGKDARRADRIVHVDALAAFLNRRKALSENPPDSEKKTK